MTTRKKQDHASSIPTENLGRDAIGVLEAIRTRGKVWDDLARQYGVTNPDPPWKTSLFSTCEALAAGTCALPAIERRASEDDLSESFYQNVPQPERELLALAHTMIERGLINEDELMRRMRDVHQRIHSV